jgi:hypothetical protein
MTSRRAPTGRPAVEWGWVYKLHLLPAYPEIPGPSGHQAKHYSGFAKAHRLEIRQAIHEGGGPHAARLLQVQHAHGGTWELVSLEWGTRDRETQHKYRGSARGCYMCEAGQAPAGTPETELGWTYVLHLEPRRTRSGSDEPQQAVHRTGFTADRDVLLEATRRGGRDAGRVLQVPAPPGGTWRLVSAAWGPRESQAQLTEQDAADLCPACSPPRARPRPAELLAAIERGEIADRVHPRHGPAARWHTENGKRVTVGGAGGSLGRNVTTLVAALVTRGLAERAGAAGPGGDRPYRLTPAGRKALEDAPPDRQAAPRRTAATTQRADGLPVNRNGSLSRSRTTDAQKAAAGVMTSAEWTAHTALAKLDHPRRATRHAGPLPEDPWTLPAPPPDPQPDARPGASALGVAAASRQFADPSWPGNVGDGVAAGARRAANGRHRAVTARRPVAPRQDAARAPGLA